jgi:TPR repeat protein
MMRVFGTVLALLMLTPAAFAQDGWVAAGCSTNPSTRVCEGIRLAWTGDQHAAGQGRPVNLEQARRDYQGAAQNHNVYATRRLGEMLLAGQGGPRDIIQGAAMLSLAADRADPVAVTAAPQVLAGLTPAERRAVLSAKHAFMRQHQIPSQIDGPPASPRRGVGGGG